MGRRWIGRWILAVGCVHTLFGVVVFHGTWLTLASEGFFNTVNGQPEREFPVWFLVSGLVVILLGALVDDLERRDLPLPGLVSWGLTLLTAALLVVMPISGGWLLVPSVIGMLLRRRRRPAA